MDVGTRAHLDASMIPDEEGTPATSISSLAHRCGQCGLLPLPEDQTRVEERQLCGVCFDMLRDVDWQHILS